MSVSEETAAQTFGTCEAETLFTQPGSSVPSLESEACRCP